MLRALVATQGRRSAGVSASRRRVRARVVGTVQGVGFRPYVYRLAGELELDGWVLNDARGVLVEVEGAPDRGRRVPGAAGREAPPLAAIERVESGEVGARRRERVLDPREPARRRRPTRRSRPTARRARTACASCSTPATAATGTRSSTAPTAGLGSRSCAGSRTTGRTRRWRRSRCARPARPSTTIRGTAGSTRSRMRARCAGLRWRCSTPTAERVAAGDAAVRAASAALRDGGSWRSRGSAASTSPAAPTTSRRWRRCARASIARTSRSR